MTTERYSRVAIALHWLMAIVLTIAWLLGQLIEDAPRGDARVAAMGLHIAAGLSAALLLLLRLAARWFGAPAFPADMPAWERKLAAAGHHALYVVMVALPVLGLTIVLTDRRDMPVLGLFTIPGLFPYRPLHDTAEGAHALAADALLVLVGLHLLAVLWHRFVRRDGTLARMLPWGGGGGSSAPGQQ